jgi:RNA polymerase sigma-70 factor (ECF subfamily)
MEANPTADLTRRADAFGTRIEPLLPSLRGQALRLTRCQAEADDLVQETVLRAWRFWDRYQEGGNLGAWLHRILRNTFINRYRRARREREVVALAHNRLALEPDDAPDPRARVLDGALSEALSSSLSALPDEYRSVLWAVAVDELSYREAADALGCPVGTVMSRLHRARRNMQRHMRRSPASAPAEAA